MRRPRQDVLLNELIGDRLDSARRIAFQAVIDEHERGLLLFPGILASAKRQGIEPFAYVRQLLIALSSAEADLRSFLPDVWLVAHPEHFLQYRRDEAEVAAPAREQEENTRRQRRRDGGNDAGVARRARAQEPESGGRATLDRSNGSGAGPCTIASS